MTDEKQIEIKRGTGVMADLLNEEIAELQKAQIEEMASVMNNVMFNYCRELDKCRDLCQYNGKSCNQYTCRDYGYAERLYKAGYRNCKNKVVLTKEEYGRLKFIEKYGDLDIEQKARKETAREILSKVGKVCGDYQWFKNLRKEYGVEVE